MSRALCIVSIAYPDAKTAEIACAGLVESGLAACAQAGQVTSSYIWQGEFNRHAEVIVTAKTTTAKLEQIQAFVRDGHPYEVSEILAVPVVWADPDYAAWVRSSVEDV